MSIAVRRACTCLIYFTLVLSILVALSFFHDVVLPDAYSHGSCFAGLELQRDGLWHFLNSPDDDVTDKLRDLVPEETIFGLNQKLVKGSNYDSYSNSEAASMASAGLNPRKFMLNDSFTMAFARIIDESLQYWKGIEGVTAGIGRIGVVRPAMLAAMANNSKVMSCCVHVKIVDLKVYFRYGSFLNDRLKLIRANEGVKMIQEAVESFNLKDMKSELFLNVCNMPLSYDNSLSPGLSGFPIFSPQGIQGSMDIVVPDPLDLHFWAPAPQFAWQKMRPVALFRGQSSNFDLKMMNVGGSARWRLHYMSDQRPDLLDAGVTEWGPSDQIEVQRRLMKEGVNLRPDMPALKMSEYKYYIVADGAVGTSDMCEALARGQVAVRQWSPFVQFFDPLLLPGLHYVQVGRTFSNLFETIEWMRSQDRLMLSIVRRANSIAKIVCSRKYRTLFWAVALSKYSHLALEDPSAVSAPTNVCAADEAVVQSGGKDEQCKVSHGKCADFCTQGLNETQWLWLSSSAVRYYRSEDPFVKVEL